MEPRRAPLHTLLRALPLALVALAACAAAPVPMRTIRFAAVVQGGQRFERPLTDSLRFVLDAGPLGREGWKVGVFAADSTANFAGIVTPPFHGPNPLDIEAWHFRNADNTGPNRGDVPAPQAEREFEFVLTSPDYRVAASALDVVLWPGERSQAAQDSAQAVWDALRRGTGVLKVTGMELGGLAEGGRPWFESMRFEVELQLPAPDDRRR